MSHEVATDQLRRAPNVLADILRGFQAATGREDIDAGLLLRYIFNRRKLKQWPRLKERARKFEPTQSMLTETDLSTLRSIYESLDETSDTNQSTM